MNIETIRIAKQSSLRKKDTDKYYATIKTRHKSHEIELRLGNDRAIKLMELLKEEIKKVITEQNEEILSDLGD